jgi:hypothetical protein
MMQSLHISKARQLLDRGEPVDLVVVKRNGELMEARNVVSLRYDYYKGTRTIKFLVSGQIRLIHDCCIIKINDFEIFL